MITSLFFPSKILVLATLFLTATCNYLGAMNNQPEANSDEASSQPVITETYKSFAQHFIDIPCDHLDQMLQDEQFVATLQDQSKAITLDQFAHFFHDACVLNHPSVVKAIFAIVGPDNTPELCNKQTFNGWTGLHLATYWGNTDIVKLILDVPNESCLMRDDNGMIALHWAIIKGHADIVTSMLAASNRRQLCTAQDEYGQTAFHHAVATGRTEIVKQILALPKSYKLCLIENNNGDCPLHVAATDGSINIVTQIFASCPSDITSICLKQNKLGRTALHCAVLEGHIEIVRKILTLSDAKSICSLKNNFNNTAYDLEKFN